MKQYDTGKVIESAVRSFDFCHSGQKDKHMAVRVARHSIPNGA